MSTNRPKVTVVGSFAVGLTLRVPRFPVAGETLLGTDFDMGPGGKGSNQAVGAARLGTESHFVGMIGADQFGDSAITLYQAEGVGIAHLQRTAVRNTGVGFITLNAQGHNHIVLDPGANLLLTPADVDAAEPLIATSDVVVSVLEIPVQAAGRAMELARRHGVTTILNPAPATRLDPAVLKQVDVLTPNAGELRILLGRGAAEDGDAASLVELGRQLQAEGAHNVVVTRGSQGAVVLHEDGAVEYVPAAAVDVVDTTGAGDAFTCALAVALGEHKSLSAAVRFAVCAGALTCTRLGVVPALPRRAAVDALEQKLH